MTEAFALALPDDIDPAPGSIHDALAPEQQWLARDPDRQIGIAYEFRIAAEALVFVRRELRKIAARHEGEIKTRYALHKAANDAKRADQGDLPAAEAILSEKISHYLRAYAIHNDSLVPAEQVPLVEGLGWSTRYKHTVKDFRKLVRAVARGKAPLEALAPNDAFLKDRVSKMRETFNVAGCGFEIHVTPIVTEPEKP